jgi:hypothetical protein
MRLEVVAARHLLAFGALEGFELSRQPRAAPREGIDRTDEAVALVLLICSGVSFLGMVSAPSIRRRRTSVSGHE